MEYIGKNTVGCAHMLTADAVRNEVTRNFKEGVIKGNIGWKNETN